MTQKKYKDTVKAFSKAEDSLENARYNINGGFYGAAANRAYYSCYYCLSALLYIKGLYSKTHTGTHAKFSESFIKTKILPTEIAGSIALLFNARQKADYDLDCDIAKEDAELLLKKAEEIFNRCSSYFHHLKETKQ